MDLITSHINADFDALASMLAAGKLYPDAVLVFPGSQERKVRDFIEVFNPVAIKRLKDIQLNKVSRLILVDTKKRDRLGQLAELLDNDKVKVHIYDHHPFNEDDIHGEIERVEDVGATATIFTELLKEKGLHPSPMEATVLALAVYAETGSLLFPSTTERDLAAVSYLLRKGANLNIVSSYLKMDLNVEELDLLNELVKSSHELVVHGIRIVIAAAERDFYMGDAARLAHTIMDMEDIDAVLVLLDMEGKILIVARSRAPELDVAELMKEFGGGGHSTAASATIREASAEIVVERLKALIPSHVKGGKSAADIMTTPVIRIQWNSSIKEAEDTMTRYGVNVLPVLKDGKYAGLLPRETVQKALYHGFKKNKCIEFAGSDAVTCSVDTPIREVETMMIEWNQRFMPVLADGEIIGAITRTDLLRVLYEEFLRKKHIYREEAAGRSPAARNLESLLKERFPSKIYDMLRTSGELAEGMGANAYLVGGSVRDLLLSRKNLDIDIVVEGDGIMFARELAKKLGAHVRPHERFGTAHLSMKGLQLDIATARTEYYESPAALPTVETSSIKKDLYRRDFTINTLAVSLRPGSFGQLIDFFGGQRDIKEKTIRVLHNLSCVEDPTRAFRAIRFSERFGFKISRHTENLIKSALQMDLFSRLSGPRLYEELIAAFNETNPVRTISRLSDFGLLKVIHPELALDEKLEAALSSMYETLAWYNLLYLEEKVDAGVLYLTVLLSVLTDEARAAALERLSAPKRTGELISKGIPASREILRRLPLDSNCELYHLLAGLETETIVFAMASTKDARKKKSISLFLVDLKKVRPLLTGEDLIKLGVPQGPVYSKILSELLDLTLKGRVKTEAEEKKFVIKHYLKKPAGR